MGILSDCMVLDLSRLLPGPFATMILADHGARVIAVEDRRFENEAMDILSSVNRNKEHITLNLKTKEGREIFYRLAKKADVIVEGFRPGVARRLGVGYETIRNMNPAIVYCSVTGYGQNGPWRDLAGHDVNFLGFSGVLSQIGPAGDSPCIPGVQLGDMAGGINAALGIVMALYGREKTGKGEYIDISMTDCLKSLLLLPFGWLKKYGQAPRRGDFLLAHRFACYNVYETADGEYITIGALEPRFWEALCDFFRVPGFAPLQFCEERKEEIIGFFKQAFRKKSRDEWLEIFSRKTSPQVCFGAVMNVEEAIAGELFQEKQKHDAEKGETLPDFIPSPLGFSENPAREQNRPPEFGEHTESVLRELGYEAEEMVKLKKDGVI